MFKGLSQRLAQRSSSLDTVSSPSNQENPTNTSIPKLNTISLTTGSNPVEKLKVSDSKAGAFKFSRLYTQPSTSIALASTLRTTTTTTATKKNPSSSPPTVPAIAKPVVSTIADEPKKSFNFAAYRAKALSSTPSNKELPPATFSPNTQNSHPRRLETSQSNVPSRATRDQHDNRPSGSIGTLSDSSRCVIDPALSLTDEDMCVSIDTLNFESGPWVAAERYVSENNLGKSKHTIMGIKVNGSRDHTVPLLIAMLKEIKTITSSETQIIIADKGGEMAAVIKKKAWDAWRGKLVVGNCIVLRDCTIYLPDGRTVSLHISASHILRCFTPHDPIPAISSSFSSSNDTSRKSRKRKAQDRSPKGSKIMDEFLSRDKQRRIEAVRPFGRSNKYD